MTTRHVCFRPALILLLPLVASRPLADAAPVRASVVQASTATAPIQVMVLGVFHFHNPNADYAQFKGTDVLTPKRQAEIAAVVAQLSRFQPTRIAVERVPAESASINGDYQRYRAGAFTLTRNELHQLGFRLADVLHLTQLYPVDFQRGVRMDSIMAYASAHDTAFVTRFNANVGAVVKELDRMQQEESIGANLRFMNEPASILRAHQPYAEMATLGARDGYVGARVVTDWYDRNLHIFANLASIAKPGDRVLLIIGMGHAPILRELIRSHPGMELVEPLNFLR